jgi:hypothetical protein
MDYCLYKDLPSKVHSETCVHVLPALDPCVLTDADGDQTSSEVIEGFYRRAQASVDSKDDALRWRQISSLTRVMPVRFNTVIYIYILCMEKKLNFLYI